MDQIHYPVPNAAFVQIGVAGNAVGRFCAMMQHVPMPVHVLMLVVLVNACLNISSFIGACISISNSNIYVHVLTFATLSSNCSNVPFRAQQSFVTATQRHQGRQTTGYHKFFLAWNVTSQHRQCRRTASHCFGVGDVGQFSQSIDYPVLNGEKQRAFGRRVLGMAVHDVAGTPAN